ncbi:hypothetical protein SH467x_003504 [Pirellulaceae bacterium SH467]
MRQKPQSLSCFTLALLTPKNQHVQHEQGELRPFSIRSAPSSPRFLQSRGRFIFTAAMICLMILTTPVKGQSGKPKQPPLPPVRYQVQLWMVPGATNYDVTDTNNQRQTVGSVGVDLDGNGVADGSHGFFYDPDLDLDIGLDLNDVVAGIPAGWYIRKATAVNEVGHITAHIEPTANMTGSNSLSVLQAVVIDMNQVPPSLQVIPDRAFTVYSVAGDINDLGYVMVRYKKVDGTWGHYVYDVYDTDPSTAIDDLGVSAAGAADPKINNAGVIVGQLSNGNGYRTSLSGGYATLNGLLPYAINENSAFCGSATVTTTKPRGTANYAFVYDSSLTLNKIANTATDLNESLDSVVFYYWLNHRTFGNLNIKDLLDPSDPNSSLIAPSCRTMTDRNPVTNFPLLGGYTTIGGISMGVHLIPVPAP